MNVPETLTRIEISDSLIDVQPDKPLPAVISGIFL